MVLVNGFPVSIPYAMWLHKLFTSRGEALVYFFSLSPLESESSLLLVLANRKQEEWRCAPSEHRFHRPCVATGFLTHR